MHARTIKLTSKRQATFPVDFCKELNLHPGERLVLDRREIDGSPAWIIQPESKVTSSWFGKLNKYGKAKSHSMDDIRRSVGDKLGADKV